MYRSAWAYVNHTLNKGQRVRHGATQYRVVWKGFAEAEATWETEASTQDWSATDLAALACLRCENVVVSTLLSLHPHLVRRLREALARHTTSEPCSSTA